VERARRIHVLILAAACVVVGLGADAAWAKLYRTRAAALELVFGNAARFEPRTVYFTPAQVDTVAQRARAPFDTARFTYWIATHGDTVLGRAYLDTREVRTMPATLLIAVDPTGHVRGVEVLAFHEPEDYLPPERWLQRFVGQKLSSHLRPGDAVDGISGATFSARAVTAAVRRSLAIDAVVQGDTH